MPIAVDELARQLFVHPGDVRVLAEWIAGQAAAEDMLSDEIGGEVRLVFDPRGERTLPQLYSQAAMDDWREEHGIGKPTGDRHVPGVLDAHRSERGEPRR